LTALKSLLVKLEDLQICILSNELTSIKNTLTYKMTKISRLDRALFKSLYKHARILDSRPLLRTAVLSDSSTGWGGYNTPENIIRGPFVAPSWEQREPGGIRGLSLIRAFAAAEPPHAPPSSSSSSSTDYQRVLSASASSSIDGTEKNGKDEEGLLSTRQQWYVPPILATTTKRNQPKQQHRLHSALEFLRQSFRRQFATNLNSSSNKQRGEETLSSSTIETQTSSSPSSSSLIDDQSAAFFVLRYITDRLSVGKHLGFDLIPTSDLGGDILPSPPSRLAPLYAPVERTNRIEPGTLLLSHPFLEAPFERKVILILEHDAVRGTIGVVINPDRVTNKVSNLTSAFTTPVVRSSALSPSNSSRNTHSTKTGNTIPVETDTFSGHAPPPPPPPPPPSSSSSSSPSPSSSPSKSATSIGSRRKRGGGEGVSSSSRSISRLTPYKIRQLLKEVEEELEKDDEDVTVGGGDQSAKQANPSFSSSPPLTHDIQNMSQDKAPIKSSSIRTHDALLPSSSLSSSSTSSWLPPSSHNLNRRRFNRRSNSLYRLAPNSYGPRTPRQSSSSSSSSSLALDDSSISHFDGVYKEDSDESNNIDSNSSSSSLSSSSSSSFHFLEAEAFESLNEYETSGRNRDRSLRSTRIHSKAIKSNNSNSYSTTTNDDGDDALDNHHNISSSSPASPPAPRNKMLENVFSKASVLARAGTAHVLLGRLRGAGIPAEKISSHAIVAASVPGESSSLGLSLLPLGPGLDMPSSVQGRKEQAEFDLKKWVPVVQLPVALVDLSSGATYGGGVNNAGGGESGEDEHLEEELRGAAPAKSNEDSSSSEDDNDDDDDDDDDALSGNSSFSSVSRGMKTKGRGEGHEQGRGNSTSRRGSRRGGGIAVTDNDMFPNSSPLASLSTEEIHALTVSAADALAVEIERLEKENKGGKSSQNSEILRLLHSFSKIGRTDSKDKNLGNTSASSSSSSFLSTQAHLVSDDETDTELSLEAEVLPLPLINQRRSRRRHVIRSTYKRNSDSFIQESATADANIDAEYVSSSSSSPSSSSNCHDSSSSSSSISSESNSLSFSGNSGSSKRVKASGGGSSIGSSGSSSSNDGDDDDDDNNNNNNNKMIPTSSPLNSSLNDVLKIFGEKKVFNGGPVPGYYLVLHPYDFLGRYAIHPKKLSASSENDEFEVNSAPILSSSSPPPSSPSSVSSSDTSSTLTQKPLFVLRDVRDAAKVAASVENTHNSSSLQSHRINRRRGSVHGSHQQQQHQQKQQKKLTSSSSFTFFSGASRWHQGQLEEELMEGSWILVKHARVADLVLTNDTEQSDNLLGGAMWSRILHSLGGEFTSWAMAPPHQ